MSSNPFLLMPVPGIIASTAEEFPQNLATANKRVDSACPSRNFLGQCLAPAGGAPASNFVGSAASHFLGIKPDTWAKLTNPVWWFTVILGLMLIAFGFFSHPAVREKIVRAGKAAGEAAALAA
jgi:hypothetical protein